MPTAKRTRKEWVVLLEEMKASGLAQTEWCKSQGINYKTMRAMKDKIEDKGKRVRGKRDTPAKATAPNTPQFIQLPQAKAQEPVRKEKAPSVVITIKDGTVSLEIHP